MIMYGIFTTPTIASVFAGPKAAQLFHDHSTWRWAFGAFTIILVAFCIPPGFIFLWSIRECKKRGIYPERANTSRSSMKTFKYHFVQFDVSFECCALSLGGRFCCCHSAWPYMLSMGDLLTTLS
jgi:hypothetical protein